MAVQIHSYIMKMVRCQKSEGRMAAYCIITITKKVICIESVIILEEKYSYITVIGYCVNM